MKTTFAGKTARQTKTMTQPDSSTGQNVISLAPPDYGIDFVDSGLAMYDPTLPIQRRQLPEEEEELMQGKFKSGPADTIQSKSAKAENKTGMPDHLKAGLENLSGMSMDHVKVHYNSSQPAQLNVLAYTQGADIHLGPGHERHLPHEAWHVVQQKQGRVGPSIHMKGVAINTDVSLENEADIMGSKALSQTTPYTLGKKHSTITSDTVQFWWPLGHREITKRAFAFFDPGQKFYPKDVQEYLIDRSPDMDFAQDVVNAMEAGITTGKDNISKMKDLLKSKNPDDIKEATKMWDENELHTRPEWYSTFHGEGGRYKENEKTATSINERITKELVNVAVKKYNGGAKKAGLSVLSDALHQAEDRGAHVEGEEFKGHDSRMTIEHKYRPKDGKYAKDLPYRKNTEYTDNAAENREGAKKAIKLAINEVFTPFRDATNNIEAEGKEAEIPLERRSKFKGLPGTVSTSRTRKSRFPGKTSKSVIRAINKKEVSEYNLLKTIDLEVKENTYVDRSIERYQDVWVISELTERIRQRLHFKWRRDTFETRQKIAEEELNKLLEVSGWFEDPKNIPDDKKKLWVSQAVHHYQYQRGKGGETVGTVFPD